MEGKGNWVGARRMQGERWRKMDCVTEWKKIDEDGQKQEVERGVGGV